ncbi:Protein JASON-like [Melia azedarach]|uniref:Protein JASON-like n=1 Tax=Melia azedarach TaxID=155640 RepID=A0ACC1YC88_MELAZ|nr:Protein JASON-like [Melia azedarach]
MVCFFACFGACKHRKRRLLVNATRPEDRGNEVTEALQLVESTRQEVTDTGKPVADSKEKIEEPSSCNTKKKVAFDLNVKAQEEEVIDNLVESNEKKEGNDLVENNDKKECEDDLVKINEEKEGDDLMKSNENINIESEKEEKTPRAAKPVSDANAVTANVISYVANHRYQNCAATEDDEDLDLEGSGLNHDIGYDDVGCDGQMLVQEESSESLFSLSIESRKQVCEVELGEKEVNSPMPKCGGGANKEVEEIGFNGNARDRSQYVHSVLNPVENLTQWKAVKGRAIPPSKYQEKENVNLMQDLDMPICPEPSFKVSKLNSNNKKVMDGETAVETSLSSWLVESETTPMSKASTVSVGNSPPESANSPRNHGDKLILRALTAKEVNQLSTSASVVPPRGSRRCRSPKEPGVGTVGCYWTHIGKIIDSDSGSSSQGMPKTRSIYNEDEKIKWHSTQLQARFECWEEF